MCTWVVNEKAYIKPDQTKKGNVSNAAFGWKRIVMLVNLFQV